MICMTQCSRAALSGWPHAQITVSGRATALASRPRHGGSCVHYNRRRDSMPATGVAEPARASARRRSRGPPWTRTCAMEAKAVGAAHGRRVPAAVGARRRAPDATPRNTGCRPRFGWWDGSLRYPPASPRRRMRVGAISGLQQQEAYPPPPSKCSLRQFDDPGTGASPPTLCTRQGAAADAGEGSVHASRDPAKRRSARAGPKQPPVIQHHAPETLARGSALTSAERTVPRDHRTVMP